MTISEIKDAIVPLKPYLFNKYSVNKIGVFGSFIRSENVNNSDLDILVEYESIPSIFKYIELENYLSSQLRIPVDLVMMNALKPSISKYILSEVQYI